MKTQQNWWSRFLQSVTPSWGNSANRSAYEGAAQGRRMRSFQPTYADINSILSAEGDELRIRCRWLVRNNSYAKNALESYSANAIGTGIKPHSKHPDEAKREQLQDWWLRWTDECDSAWTTDFYGLQKQICEATLEAGECFVRLRPRPNSDGLFVPLQLQILEAEHVPLEKNETTNGGNPIISGIEFDRRGRRMRYHMYRHHPGSGITRLNSQEIVPVPADSVLHQYRCRRPEQVRGEPSLVPVIVQLYELDQYEDAELVRKKTAAMISHFIRVTNPLETPSIGQDEEDALYGGQDDITQVVPGSVVYLRENEDVTASQAVDVGNMYGEFMSMNLYRIAAGLGISYEMLTGDLRRVNYSSIRAGQLEIRRRIEQYQHHVMVYQLCRPVWRAFLEACVFGGLIDAREYRRNQKDYLAVDWRTPAWPWVDPLKDVQARVLEINNRLTSRDSVIHERGEDPETVDKQIEAGAERSGYEPAVAPPAPTPASAAPASPPARPTVQ